MNENNTAYNTPPPPPRGRRPVGTRERSPRKVAAVVAGVILAAGIGLYILSGLAAAWLVNHVSPEYERSFGKSLAEKACSRSLNREAEDMRRIMQPLVRAMGSDNPGYRFEVCLAQDRTLNAFALPGGWVVVNSGLLQAVESDAEIAFVLAHELGHFRHRHHLRKLGRGLVLYLALSFISDQGSFGASLLADAGVNKFSRDHEREADAYAVELLRRTGGDIRGGIDLLERLSRGDAGSGIMEYFSTHPDPEKRMKRLREALEQ